MKDLHSGIWIQTESGVGPVRLGEYLHMLAIVLHLKRYIP